jgi:hypothetical protein
VTRQLIIVMDKLDQAALPFYERQFKLDALAEDLGKAGLAARIFVGKLEDAPESWAYLLITDEEEMLVRLKDQPVIQTRTKRALGVEFVPQRAAALAESLGLLGVMTGMGSWFGSRRDDAKTPNSLLVKRSVATQLKWEVFDINGSENYAFTRGITMTLPKLIIEYLTAALPAEVGP